MNSPENHRTLHSRAWLTVALLFPVALLNYLDRQIFSTMEKSISLR